MKHASKLSGLDRISVGLLQERTGTGKFIHCSEEQEFRGAESEERQRHPDEKRTGSSVTSGGYVKVRVVPRAYDQGAEAKRDDPESAPLLWFWHPHSWGVARSGGIGRKILHLLLGSVKTIGLAK